MDMTTIIVAGLSLLGTLYGPLSTYPSTRSNSIAVPSYL